MDFGALPPEINSARMYSGPGSVPMLDAAAAWDALAAELRSTASSYQALILEITNDSWLGPASTSMAAAVAPYATWMSITGAQAEQTASDAAAAASAFETAFAMTVPPAEVAANRAQLAALVATNFLGLNTPAIAATEAQYGEMWTQDAAAMYAYASSSASASALKPFTQPAQTTNPTGLVGQAEAVAQATGTAVGSGTQNTLSQLISALPSALQSLASPLASANPIWSFLNSNFFNGFFSGGYINPGILTPAVTAAMSDINSLQTPGLMAPVAPPGGFSIPAFAGMEMPAASRLVSAHMAAGLPGLGGVSAAAGRGAFIGKLSVPQTWTAVTEVTNHAGTALPGGGWTGTALGAPDASAGMPGVPGIPASRGYNFGNGPRYGFRPTIMAHPPAAG